MEIFLHTLGYADDVVLVLMEEGDEPDTTRVSERVTDISKGSRRDVDM